MSDEILKDLAKKEAWKELARELCRRGYITPDSLPYFTGDRILLQTKGYKSQGGICTYLGILKGIGKDWLFLNPCNYLGSPLVSWELKGENGYVKASTEDELPSTFTLSQIIRVQKIGNHILMHHEPWLPEYDLTALPADALV